MKKVLLPLLQDPATAIPKGTMLAIFFTMATYLVYGLMSGGCSIRYASGAILTTPHFLQWPGANVIKLLTAVSYAFS